jgi:hypothetical protein
MKIVHELIKDMELKTVETFFTNHRESKKDYFIIPTDFLIANITNNELWGGSKSTCFDGVNFDMLECMEELTKEGQYLYNSIVAERFCDKFNLGKYDESKHRFLSSMVYCNQQYRRQVQDEMYAKMKHEKLTNEGYKVLLIIDIDTLIETKSKCFVYLNYTNMVGAEGQKQFEKKLVLRRNGDGIIWMTPQSSRKGYTAQIGQYYKTV